MTQPDDRTTDVRAFRNIAEDIAGFARARLASRAALTSGAMLVLIGGIALNWSALVAAGIAPILIGLLPCAIMCGLGLCMHRMTGGSCSDQSDPKTDDNLRVHAPHLPNIKKRRPKAHARNGDR